MDEIDAELKWAEKFYFQGGDIGFYLHMVFLWGHHKVSFILGGEISTILVYCSCSLFKGSDTHYYELEKCSYKDWYRSIELGYKD